MKKLNNKGFMLTEVLIVSILLIVVLLAIYVQFKNVNRKVSNSFSHNTVSSLYNLHSVKLYIEQEKFDVIVSQLGEVDYVELTSCLDVYFDRQTYCNGLFSSVGIKRIFATNENLYSLIEKKPFDEKLNDFIASIDYEANDGYRLIAEYKDGTYASLKFLNQDKFLEEIANTCTMNIKKNYLIHFVDTNGNILKDSFQGESGCGSTISVSRFFDALGTCYYNTGLINDTLVISENEENNQATLIFEKNISTLTIHHIDQDNNKLSEDTVITNSCGQVYETENYKKVIPGYNYVSASETLVTLTENNKEISLYYEEGSGVDE